MDDHREEKSAQSLRAEAKKRLAGASGAKPEREGKTHEEIVHELDVHQIELEMQNDALRKAQLDLEESRDRYADLYEFAPLGYFTFTGRGVIKDVNLTGASLLGVERKKLLDRGFGHFVAEDNLSKWERHLRDVQQNPQKQTSELLLEREDGFRFYARLESVRVDLSGGTSVVRSIVSDITERKRAENIVQARVRMLVAAVNLSVDQMLQMALDEIEAQTGSVIGFYHYLEEDQETLSLQTWSTNTLQNMCTASGKGMHYPVSQAGVWVDCVIERRPVIHNDYRSLPHRKGMPPGHAPVIREMVIPIVRLERIVAIIGVGNKPTDYNATDVEVASLLGDFSWEIIERKRAEEALNTSEKRYRELFENMIDGFAYCKMVFEDGKPRDFIYLSVNHAFEMLTGLKTVVGKRVTEVIPGIREGNPELFEIYGRVSLTGKPERFQVFVEALKIWFSVSVYSPEREFFVAIFDNFTERKNAEEKIRVLNEQLKHRVADLDVANKELEAFNYSVSHDLRAPLRHITGFMKLLQQRLGDRLDVETRRYMDTIYEASTKMSMLIEDLLNFSRLGRSEMQKRKVDLNTLVNEVIREIKEDLKERKIRFEIDELPVVLGDKSLLRQVFVNLLSNAVKFTSTRPQAEIKIGCKDEGDKFTCYVTDNGVGFDMKYADKLFGVFQRLHRQAEFEGIGIGLANVQRIIARHGGRVWAESVMGQGATFYFSLPKYKEA